VVSIQGESKVFLENLRACLGTKTIKKGCEHGVGNASLPRYYN
jgi:hypothetical protein